MAMTTLYTIGYEGSSITDFLSTLGSAGVEQIIDVREVPISRKAGFSKSKLTSFLSEYDIDYVHLKNLGDPKMGRIAAREGRFADFREIYANHLRTQAAKNEVLSAVESAKRKTSCLLCFERDHHFCHREMVANQMAKIGEFKIVHLGVRIGLSLQRKLLDSISDDGKLSAVR